MTAGPLIVLALTFTTALGDDPTFGEGVRLYQELNYEQAIFRFQQVAVRPSLPPAEKATALLWLGLSYAGAGDLDEAARSFRFALETDRTATLPTETSPSIVKMVDDLRAEVALTPTPPPAPPPPPSPAPPPTPGLAVIGAGVGAAVGVLAIVGGGLLAWLTADQLAKANDPDAFQDDANQARLNANAAATGAVVLIPLGGVLAAAGGVVLAMSWE
ncbi:MAG: hypothetical protein A2138_15420 [Deltaproteobacteria bacterium RBG_16_71_12]|nr:MAG: hypothetical protein A2138_15420 [Deltaproteobacteria bacterium RBG_16_71_12]